MKERWSRTVKIAAANCSNIALGLPVLKGSWEASISDAGTGGCAGASGVCSEGVVLEDPEDGEVPEDEEELEDVRWVVSRVMDWLKVMLFLCWHRYRDEKLEIRT